MSKRKLKDAIGIVEHHLAPYEVKELIDAAQAHMEGRVFDAQGNITDLKDQIEGFQDRIAELEEKTERQNVVSEFQWTPSATAMTNEIVRLRRQNAEIIQTILDVDELVHAGAREYTQRAEDSYQKLLPAEESGQLSGLSKAILTHTVGPLHQEYKTVQAIRQQRLEQKANQTKPLDMREAVREALDIIIANVRTTNASYLMSLMVGTADEVNKMPNYVAGEIIRQCKSKGGPDIELVQLLPLDWIKANLKEPPDKHETLRAGLKGAQEFKVSGINNMGAFIDLKQTQEGSSLRSLEKYNRWYQGLEQLGSKFPEVAEKLPIED